MSQIIAMLVGGRPDLPEQFRTATVATLDEKVTVEYAGHYERFVHEGEFTTLSGRKVPVFTWTYRTAIAE